jgi:hypothetical protein
MDSMDINMNIKPENLQYPDSDSNISMSDDHIGG